MFDYFARYAPQMFAVWRIMTGLLFAQHGIQKILKFPVPEPRVPTFPELDVYAGTLELIGGPLIVLGLFTRPVAFILAGEMAAAYFMVHAPRSFFPIVNNGNDPVLYCFNFLYLTTVGGGIWSLDQIFRRKT